jgi:hypothetical protein
MIDPNDPEALASAIRQAEEENIKDMHIGQLGASRGDVGRRSLSFGPSAQANPNPTQEDITSYQIGYPEDPTTRQAQHGQEYMRQYHDLGKEDNMPSVHDTKTQSFVLDDVTEEDPEKTDPGIKFDDDTVTDPGFTLHSINPEDDIHLPEPEPEDFGTFEDDDTDEEEIGLLQRIKDGFKKIQQKYF